MRAPAHNITLQRGQRRALRAVAMFELTKGIFVLVMGICALLLVHRDLWLMAESLLALLHVNTDRRFAQLFLDFADNITDARLWAAARIAFAYAVLRFAESYGLWRARSWAEWLALISGTLLLPFEVRELLRGVTTIRIVLFLGNLGIVFYMYHLIRSGQLLRKIGEASAAPPNQSSTR
jgi:uncharacterized membrane protein (DUF2068 family)